MGGAKPMNDGTARRMWQLYEPIHDVTYFTPEARAAAANQALPRPAQPHLALWQATTTLREHRGDGHIAVLLARGVSPVQAHLIKAAAGEADPAVLRESRRWSADAWRSAVDELSATGW